VAIGTLPASAQTLAEAAAAAKLVVHEWPAFVYTNADLKDAPPIVVPPPSASVVLAKPDADTKKDETKTEAYWRARLRPLAAQLTTDVLAAESLNARHAELRARFNGMTTVFQQQLVAPEMLRVETDLKATMDRADGDARAIEDLKEEGRRAGALPGWFR